MGGEEEHIVLGVFVVDGGFKSVILGSDGLGGEESASSSQKKSSLQQRSQSKGP